MRDPAGRYRTFRQSRWGTFGSLSPHARLVELALRLGSLSNIPGIFFCVKETLMRETGLSAEELETALVELDGGAAVGVTVDVTRYTSATKAVIMRDSMVVWVKDALRDAPKVLDARHRFASDLHRKGVLNILALLPATSPVVQKFKRTYRLALQAPSQGVAGGASEGAAKYMNQESEVEVEVEVETGKKNTNGDRERERKPHTAGDASPAAPSVSVSLSNDNHGKGNTPDKAALSGNGSSNGHERLSLDYQRVLARMIMENPGRTIEWCDAIARREYNAGSRQ